jgi:CubicO group peptidase (beta-lactamase class C family)
LNPLALLATALGTLQLPVGSDSLADNRVVGPLGTALDSSLTRFAAYGFSGTVLVMRQNRIVLLKGYGLADVERGVPNRAVTRYEMNSMTKMFTGVAILQLVASGRLGLNDPVERHLGPFPPGKQGATVAHLTTHTSGLIVAGTNLAGDTRDDFVRDVKRTPRESPPGTQYRYTNAGFSLLAALIEMGSGETYEQYLRRHEFTPAGMGTAIFRNEVPRNDSLFARGYVGTPARLEAGPPNPYIWGTIGAGGVWSTVGDMYRWLIALKEHRVLPEAEWQVLIRPPTAPAEEAFGWHVEQAPDGRPRISKGGGSDDFASQFLYYPTDSVVIIWASNNLRQRWRSTLNAVLPATVFGTSPLSLPPVVSVTPAELQARSGRFTAGADTVELKHGSGYLFATSNQVGIPTDVMFFPQDRDHFTAFDPSRRVTTGIQFDGGDRAWVTFMLADGKRHRAHRVP